MSKVVRTVRFEKSELDKIDQFLKKNSFLDFSALTRLAINNFIENPTAQFRPLGASKKPHQKDREI